MMGIRRLAPCSCPLLPRRAVSSRVRDDDIDTLVIGGGAVGSSTAYHLATSRGFEDPSVLVVEQDPSYGSCSAVYSAGGIRCQFSLRENVLMSLYGIDFLRKCGTLLSSSESDEVDIQYVENGYLLLASTESGVRQLRKNHSMYRQAGCDDMVELLEPDELKSRFPWIRVDDLKLASYGCSGEGWFDPWAYLRGLTCKNKERGVKYLKGTVVGAAREADSGRIESVDVKTSDCNIRTIRAKTIVNAAGARAGQVMDVLAGDSSFPILHPLPVFPRKRSIYFFHCDTNQEAVVPPVAPLTIDSTGAYFRSEGVRPGTGLFLCGVSPPCEEDLDCYDADELKNADPVLFERDIWPSIANRVPAFNNLKVVSSWAGLYEVNVVDRNCILDFHPEIPNVLMINGFSGHGLQHSPAAGRAAAELIDNNNRFLSLDLNIFRFDRLMEGGTPVFESEIY